MESILFLLLVGYSKVAARLYQYIGSIFMNFTTLCMAILGLSEYIPVFVNWFPLALLN